MRKRAGTSHSGPPVSGPWGRDDAPRTEGPRGGGETPAGGGGRAAWQWGAACTLCLIATAVMLRGSPAASPVMAQLTRLASAEEEEAGGLHYVSRGLAEAAVAVFAPVQEFRALPPCEGTRLTRAETGGEPLSLYAADVPAVCAVADGRVFYVGENDEWGPYIRVEHGGGFASLYAGVEACVRAGDSLRQGDILGEAVGGTVGFILRKNGSAVDEADYAFPGA